MEIILLSIAVMILTVWIILLQKEIDDMEIMIVAIFRTLDKKLKITPNEMVMNLKELIKDKEA